MRVLRYLLLPLSCLYWLAISIRNKFYDIGVFKSKAGALTTIVIGNLTTGGTGKTPHALFILQKLSATKKVALLSRGYKRQSTGYRLAGKEDNHLTIGDEPMLIHQRLPDIPVAVCEDRLAGIARLKEQTDTQLVVLDDAFQHRRLRGNLNILLTDYHRPYWDDFLLPAGNLRDSESQSHRADAIVVTKCPPNMDESAMQHLLNKIQPTENQQMYFTCILYGTPVCISGDVKILTDFQSIAGFAGLAAPFAFREFLSSKYSLKKFKVFPDHHIFSLEDIGSLWRECGNFADALVTTEKDAVRLNNMQGLRHIPIFYIPIEIRFLKDEERFEKLLQSVA